ncbi:LysR family transcriptional regulator [Variovorax paradoxus]|nr:LysR family transcriptional regulator [Variovorax paradoxus]
MKPDPARFDLVSIRLALLCAELGSISAAARRVHCSISTASYRLTALERGLGAQLFTRDRRGLRTTRAGELFAKHAIAVLERVHLMNRLVCAAESETAYQSVVAWEAASASAELCANEPDTHRRDVQRQVEGIAAAGCL